MHTDCSEFQLEFQGLNQRKVVAEFDGGRVSSDGGVLLLREVNERTGLTDWFASCFEDHRNPSYIEHEVSELVAQRVMALALGYEDLNDHNELRDDALLAVSVGKRSIEGNRKRSRDQGHCLASSGTLNRLELSDEEIEVDERYKRISYSQNRIDQFLVDYFLAMHKSPPKQVILDMDATDDPIHGHQEGRFFHGYYNRYCYLPLYITCGDDILCARLRPSNIDGAAGVVDELDHIVLQIRIKWPETRIIVRGDSGFAREELMAWCERRRVDYVLGLARNKRLVRAIGDAMARARKRHKQSGKPEREFKDLRYRTRKSWSRRRRVVGKAERLVGKANPRFVVTSLSKEEADAKSLYEEIYCARGDMENRIKEQQLDMFADRTSCHTMRANQLRLYFSTVAYMLINEFRRCGLKGTHMARAQAGTIRTRLLKIGAIIKISVRRIHIALSSVYPKKSLFALALYNIQAAHPAPG